MDRDQGYSNAPWMAPISVPCDECGRYADLEDMREYGYESVCPECFDKLKPEYGEEE